jgi:hypothetical protein
MAACHGVPDEMTFHSWEQLKGLPKLGDAVVRRYLSLLAPHLHQLLVLLLLTGRAYGGCVIVR